MKLGHELTKEKTLKEILKEQAEKRQVEIELLKHKNQALELRLSKSDNPRRWIEENRFIVDM
ncbi:hypothetical protein Ciccas_003000 [Cichlidogyrus casuarinus]|uniref:Uncharacterized protein n=1 Tax=Cichlidogyrus casuarinus TaxID=1844966 RepID=A0ABD2QFM4_9PLAT